MYVHVVCKREVKLAACMLELVMPLSGGNIELACQPL